MKLIFNLSPAVEAWRKTHAQLGAEVVKEAVPVRKSHDELQTEVFPDGLPAPVHTMPVSPHVMVTPVQNATPEFDAPPKATAPPLRRHRSGTIMMRAPPAESLPPPVPQPDLTRSRSMLEARTQMFERDAPARAQTISVPRPLRQKNASFERAKSLFHAPDTNKAASEGSRTPPRVSRKLDMSKFGFS
jgi:hypothetical protein